jgi:gliding motility-associated-like protein
MTICGTAQIPMTTSPAQTGTYRIVEVSTGIVRETGTYTTNGQLTTNAYAPGDFIIEVTNASNCLAASTVTLNAGPAVSNTSINMANLCTTSQVTAIGTGATTFDWSLSPAGSVTPLNSATVNVAAGVWTLQVIMDDGAGPLCADTVTQVVSVDNFVPDFTFDPCTTPVLLTATATANQQPLRNYSYAWSGAASGTGQVFSTTTSGSYTLSMSSPLSGCPAKTVSKNVTVAGPLSVVITTMNPPCEGSAFSLLATPSRAVNSYQWALDGNNLSGQIAAQLSNQQADGLYGVTVSDGLCSASADLAIVKAPVIPGKLFDNAMICPDDANPNPDTRQVVLDPGADFVSYDWFEVISGTPSPLGVTTQTYTTNVAGIYLVNLINLFGCESSDQTEVSVECDPVIVGPNAFRPTSALNTNQAFKLLTFFIDDTDFQVYIFNRWGEMIFESSDRNFAWNGGYKNNLGQIMPAGTYSYVVRYKSAYRPDDGIQEKRGGVLLVR